VHHTVHVRQDLDKSTEVGGADYFSCIDPANDRRFRQRFYAFLGAAGTFSVIGRNED
jgi:hypothetical protein